jgi:hypothetical protein
MGALIANKNDGMPELYSFVQYERTVSSINAISKYNKIDKGISGNILTLY